ncbi:hypothetical protein MVEN_02593700 [Mycena venus]|uniref:Protein kinase domain-containing protein n=1 Tax=Mycena venus TaxID=2733690 RepID=A0A8H6WR66_9AGAR|nr:hypothetical protein MVEN_02593700 [Mycena venus]
MYDEAHAAPPTTGVPSNPGTMGGTFHAAISNSTSGDITMIGCTTTTNLAFTATPTLPSDFRMIPFGDIDLRHELRVDYKTGVGDRAEEEWKCDVEKYRSLRHPNIIQLWGATRAGGIYALLFHGDLIPFQLFVNSYQHTPCVQAYIYASCIPEFMAASNYCHSIFHQHLLEKQSTFWIRRSTGRLCAELEKPWRMVGPDSNAAIY